MAGRDPGPNGGPGILGRLNEILNPMAGRGLFHYGPEIVRDMQRRPLSNFTVKGDIETHQAGSELIRQGHPWAGAALQTLGAGSALLSGAPLIGGGIKRVTGDVAERMLARYADDVASLPRPQQTHRYINLEHRGPKAGGIKEVDPAYGGTGQRGAERKRAKDPDYVDRSYHEVAGTAPERRFEGMEIARGEVDEGTIAPWDVYEQYYRTTGDATQAEALLAAQGWAGYRGANGAIATFGKTPNLTAGRKPGGATGKGVDRVAAQARSYINSITRSPRQGGVGGFAGVEGHGANLEYLPIDPDRARRMADVYEELPHAPNDPKVQQSYNAMAQETAAQYQHLVDRGVKFEPAIDDPYANSAEMIADVRDNNRLKFFLTDLDDFPADHPLAKPSGVYMTMPDGTQREMVYNDLFRAVHDYFGHASEGFQFGPRGEDNAWALHAAMFSDEARPAMTFETRGQNSWVNFGPQMRGSEGQILKKGEEGWIHPSERAFAEQKANIMPDEFLPIRPQQPAAAAGDDLPFVEGTEQFAKPRGQEWSVSNDKYDAVGSYDPETRTITVGNIQGEGMGSTAIRDLLRGLQMRFPHATSIQGLRTTGGRGKEVTRLLKPRDAGFDPDFLKANYPTAAPVEMKQGRRGLYAGRGKDEATDAFHQLRKDIQKDMDERGYTPYFDPDERYYAGQESVVRERGDVAEISPRSRKPAEWQAKLGDSDAVELLKEAYERGSGDPNARMWYAMGQLEDRAIQELGEEAGRKWFREDFADLMAATTAGQDPTSNLMSAAYVSHLRRNDMPLPGKGEVPKPVTGEYMNDNVARGAATPPEGLNPTTQPKGFSFSSNFLGALDLPTVDAQMMEVFSEALDKVLKAPPNANTGGYRVFRDVVRQAAEESGIPASRSAEFQDVAWAGIKAYKDAQRALGPGATEAQIAAYARANPVGKPMIDHVNDAIERTARLTNSTPDEVVQRWLNGGPLFGVAGVATATDRYRRSREREQR